MTVSNPYRNHGLRRNPFAWDRDGRDPGPRMHRDVTRRINVAPGQSRLVELVGVNGSGKTTQLEAWAVAQQAQVYEVPEPAHRWERPLPPVAPVCFWDEVDRLSPRQQRIAFRKAMKACSTVVVATHMSVAPVAQKQGLLVTSVTLPAITHEELQSWAKARIGRALLPSRGLVAAPSVEPPENVLRQIAANSGASWRTAGDLLHVWMAQVVNGHIPDGAVG